MLTLYFQSLWRFLLLALRSVWPPRGSGARRSWRRVALMLLFLPLFGLVQTIHWLCMLLDEIFFPGYRRVTVRAPLFVTGVPRSGTTLLHRTLAEDPGMTTFSTWECLFAPSVTQRRIVQGCAWVDRRIGRPAERLLRVVERAVVGGLDGIHDTSLAAPEEDYFVFTPVLACFILVVPFPYAEWIWQMGHFDEALDSRQKKRLMHWYRLCLQKHLYAHGADKRLLSKNASFPPLLAALRETFPDARYICCMREPVQTVISQLSSLDEGLALFHDDPHVFRERLVAQLAFYYRHLLDVLGTAPESERMFVAMETLQSGLDQVVTTAYRQLGIPLQDEFLATLTARAEAARGYVSTHRYRASDYGLDEAGIATHFASIYERYDFAGESADAEAPR